MGLESDAKTIQTAEEAYSANSGVCTLAQADLVNAGLMHAASTKFTIALVAAVVGLPAKAASYTLTRVVGGDCVGMTF